MRAGEFFFYPGWGILATMAVEAGISKAPVVTLDAAATFTGGPPDQSALDLAAFEEEVAAKVGSSKKRAAPAVELPPAKPPAGAKSRANLAFNTYTRSVR